MEAHPSPPKPGRAEVDTSRPFQSVKEAVAVFGDRILAGEVYGSKSNNITPTARKSQQSSSGSFSSFDSSSSHLKQEEDHEMPQASIKRLEAELIETRRELKLLKERESQMEIAVASLNAELHKSMSKLAAAEASMVAAARTSSIKGGLALYGEQEEIVEEGKVEYKDGRLEHSQCLAELLSLGERKGYYATLEEKKKIMKKKPIIPLISDLWRKKSPVSHYSYLYSCPSYLS